MIFNKIIDHLRLWCVNKGNAYHYVYQKNRGITYVGYIFTDELEFKLMTFIDVDFQSLDELKCEIKNMLDIHYEPSILKPVNQLTIHIIDKTTAEFLRFADEIFDSYKDLSEADIPYKRAVIGKEADILINKFREIWGYVNTDYWYPLNGNFPEEITSKFYVMSEYAKPYLHVLELLLKMRDEHVYRYGENNFYPPHVLEVDGFSEFKGLEMIYTDKDFSWAIYFSHEDTVAFAGSIVDMVKNLLKDERENFNKFVWDD